MARLFFLAAVLALALLLPGTAAAQAVPAFTDGGMETDPFAAGGDWDNDSTNASDASWQTSAANSITAQSGDGWIQLQAQSFIADPGALTGSTGNVCSLTSTGTFPIPRSCGGSRSFALIAGDQVSFRASNTHIRYNANAVFDQRYTLSGPQGFTTRSASCSGSAPSAALGGRCSVSTGTFTISITGTYTFGVTSTYRKVRSSGHMSTGTYYATATLGVTARAFRGQALKRPTIESKEFTVAAGDSVGFEAYAVVPANTTMAVTLLNASDTPLRSTNVSPASGWQLVFIPNTPIAAAGTVTVKIELIAQGTVTGTAYGGVDSAVLLYTASTAVVTGPSPPSGLATSRSAASITLSWSAPAGDVDNYAAQREELRVIGGVARWANTVSLGNPWLPASLSYYEDTTIVPSVTYRYRIASVTENAAGDYSEWGNSSPAHFSFGDAPAAFTLDKARDVAYDTHREFWLTWSAVSGATIYELQLRRFSIAPISETSEILRVSHTDAAITAFSPVSVRVRARGDCSGAPCYTEWTAWNTATFTPKPRTIPVAPLVAPGSDVMTFREDIEEVIGGALGPAGLDPDEGQVVELAILTVAAVLALVSVWIGMRRGAAPLGFGMACAASVLVLFLGYRLLGTPLAWPVAAQILIILPGLYALVRQFGILR